EVNSCQILEGREHEALRSAYSRLASILECSALRQYSSQVFKSATMSSRVKPSRLVGKGASPASERTAASMPDFEARKLSSMMSLLSQKSTRKLRRSGSSMTRPKDFSPCSGLTR